jgi:hypothetical protein
MGLEELSYAAGVPIVGDKLLELEEIENLVVGMEVTRYLAREWPCDTTQFQHLTMVFKLHRCPLRCMT